MTPESTFPLPSTARVLHITPEMASDWLTSRNHPLNRRLSPHTADKYRRDMEQDRWKLTRQGIVFDTDGKLIDGQHRLKAIANSGIEREFWIYPNEARDTFDGYDQNYRRTAAHLLGGISYATNIAGAARILAATEERDRWGLPAYPRVTAAQVVDTFHQWPELTRWSKDLHSIAVASHIGMAPHLSVLVQASRTEHADRIPEWIEGLQTGANLTPTDPRLRLRERFRTGSPMGRERLVQNISLITKAWNAWALKEPLQSLRHSVGIEAMPRVVGYGSGG